MSSNVCFRLVLQRFENVFFVFMPFCFLNGALPNSICNDDVPYDVSSFPMHGNF